jgi:uncharacterized protein (TIGR02246 family)
MDRAGVEAWMEGYRRAWVANDPDEVEALFTPDAVYAQDAFQPPWNGRDEIIRLWTAGISQDVEMDAQAVEYDGVIVLRFDGDRCRDLREWFFRRELQ